jgi:hypothetical protein
VITSVETDEPTEETNKSGTPDCELDGRAFWDALVTKLEQGNQTAPQAPGQETYTVVAEDGPLSYATHGEALAAAWLISAHKGTPWHVTRNGEPFAMVLANPVSSLLDTPPV